MKILNGSLRVRDEINGEKINRSEFIRGRKVPESGCGRTGDDLCGNGTVKVKDRRETVLEPVLT